MAIEDRIYSGLTEHAPLAALVGTRIYPAGERPQGVGLPAVTHQRISTPIESAMTRGVVSRRPRFQFNCLAASHDACRSVMVAVVDAILTITSGGGTTLGSVVIDSERGPYHVPDSQMYRGEVDVLILHQGV